MLQNQLLGEDKKRKKMKLTNLKRIIAEELTKVSSSKSKKRNGCGKRRLNEGPEGKCIATIMGETVPCMRECNVHGGCDAATINLEITSATGDREYVSGECYCDNANPSLVGGPERPIRR
jgi:hypothetical protein